MRPVDIFPMVCGVVGYATVPHECVPWCAAMDSRAGSHLGVAAETPTVTVWGDRSRSGVLVSLGAQSWRNGANLVGIC